MYAPSRLQNYALPVDINCVNTIEIWKNNNMMFTRTSLEDSWRCFITFSIQGKWFILEFFPRTRFENTSSRIHLRLFCNCFTPEGQPQDKVWEGPNVLQPNWGWGPSAYVTIHCLRIFWELGPSCCGPNILRNLLTTIHIYTIMSALISRLLWSSWL